MGKFAKWTGKSLIRAAVLLVLVSAASFFLLALSPVDPLQNNVGQAALGSMSSEQVEKLKEYWGVGVPATERFVSWFTGILHGDMGTSLLYRRPVAEIVGERFLSSIWLMASAWLLAGVIGICLGITAGAFRGKWPDRVITGYCMLTASTPAFWIGLMLLLVFAVWIPLFPVGLGVPIGVEASRVTLADRISHAFLPALTLAITGVSGIALHTKAKMEEIMDGPYVLYARARGESLFQIVRRHGLRNVLLPALTLQFASVSEIFGGSVLVEQVFSYPGLGQAAIAAGLGSDVPLLLGITLISAVFVFAGNLTADLLYRAADPRMREEGRKRKRKQKPVLNREGEKEGRERKDVSDRQGAVSVLISGWKWETENVKDQGNTNSVSGAKDTSGKDEEAEEKRRKPFQDAAGKKGIFSALKDRRTRTLMLTAASVILLTAAALAGAAWTKEASVSDFARKNLAPGFDYLFGTDWLGRDMFLRTMAGLSMSIRLGLLTAFISAVIALVLGVTAAMGKTADAAVSSLIDLVMGIPHMLLLILIACACQKGLAGVVTGISLTHWPSLARLIRGEVLQLKESQYIKISRQLGMSRLKIVCRHMFPHLLPQFLTGLILMFPHAILHEASLTFLGFGLPPEAPAIGTILSESMRYLITGKWWLAVFPGLLLTAVVLLFETLGRSAGRLLSPGGSQE